MDHQSTRRRDAFHCLRRPDAVVVSGSLANEGAKPTENSAHLRSLRVASCRDVAPAVAHLVSLPAPEWAATPAVWQSQSRGPCWLQDYVVPTAIFLIAFCACITWARGSFDLQSSLPADLLPLPLGEDWGEGSPTPAHDKSLLQQFFKKLLL